MVRRVPVLLLAALFLPACSDGLESDAAGPAALEAPTELRTKGAPDMQVQWRHAGGGETGFRLEVNDGPFGAPPYRDVVYAPAGATSLAYEAPPGKTLRLRVFAVDDTRQSAPSNEVEVVVPAVPERPAHFSALALGPATVELRWVAPGSGTSVVLRRSADGGQTWATAWSQIDFFGRPFDFPQTVTLSDHAAGLDYRYRLTLGNSEGTGLTAETSTHTEHLPAWMQRVVTPNDDAYRISACARNGLQHVVHYDGTGGNLMRIVSGSSGLLTTERIDGPAGFWPGVVGWHGTSVDDDGTLQVAAHEYEGGQLRCYQNGGGGWSAVSVGPSGSGYDPQLRSRAGRTYILHRTIEAWSSGPLRLASGPARGPWLLEDAVPGGPIGDFSMGAGSSGELHVVYVRADRKGLFHRRRDVAGAWTEEPITEAGAPQASAVAVDPSGAVFVVWHESAKGELWFAEKVGGVWRPELLHRHSGGNLGAECAIAWGDGLHVAYRNTVQNDLWYARRGPDGWSRRLVDSVGDVGRGVVVSVDGGTVWLAYRDHTNGDVKLVRNP